MYFDVPRVPRKEQVAIREKEILQIIVAFQNKHHYPPTIREIKRYASVSSTSTIYKYLTKLKEKGYITWEDQQSRSITILCDKY